VVTRVSVIPKLSIKAIKVMKIAREAQKVYQYWKFVERKDDSLNKKLEEISDKNNI
ncbi:hypothetical protein LCGC14_1344450, partial [marine sediment metagenome]